MNKTTHLLPLYLQSKPHQCSYDFTLGHACRTTANLSVDYLFSYHTHTHTHACTHTYLNVEHFFICHLFIVSLINDWEPLKNGAAGPRSKPHIPPLGSETLGFGQKHDATVDIPLDTLNVVKLLFPFLFFFCSLIFLRELSYVLDGMVFVGF